MGEDDVAAGDGLLFRLLHAALGRGIATEQGIVELARHVSDALALDLEKDFIDDLSLIVKECKSQA